MWINMIEMKPYVMEFVEKAKEKLTDLTLNVRTDDDYFELSFQKKHSNEHFFYYLEYDFYYHLLSLSVYEEKNDFINELGRTLTHLLFDFLKEKEIDLLLKSSFIHEEDFEEVKFERSLYEWLLPTGENAKFIIDLYDGFFVKQSFTTNHEVKLMDCFFEYATVELRHEVYPVPKLKFIYQKKESHAKPILLFEVSTKEEKEKVYHWFKEIQTDICELKELFKDAPKKVKERMDVRFTIREAELLYVTEFSYFTQTFRTKEEAKKWILFQLSNYKQFISMMESMKTLMKEKDPYYVCIEDVHHISINHYTIKCFFAGKFRELSFYFKDEGELIVEGGVEQKIQRDSFEQITCELKEQIEKIYSTYRLKELYNPASLKLIPTLLQHFNLLRRIKENVPFLLYPIRTSLTIEEINRTLFQVEIEKIPNKENEMIQIGDLYMVKTENYLYIEHSLSELEKYDEIKKTNLKIVS